MAFPQAKGPSPCHCAPSHHLRDHARAAAIYQPMTRMLTWAVDAVLPVNTEVEASGMTQLKRLDCQIGDEIQIWTRCDADNRRPMK